MNELHLSHNILMFAVGYWHRNDTLFSRVEFVLSTVAKVIWFYHKQQSTCNSKNYMFWIMAKNTFCRICSCTKMVVYWVYAVHNSSMIMVPIRSLRMITCLIYVESTSYLITFEILELKLYNAAVLWILISLMLGWQLFLAFIICGISG